MRAFAKVAALATSLWAAGLLVAGAASAAPAVVVRTPHVQAELIPETTAAAPGGVLYVALRQKIAAGWHTYWRNPGDAGQATTIAWTLPTKWHAGDIVWPAPEQFLNGPIMAYVYADQVLLPVPVQVPADAKPGSVASLKAQVAWLVCKDVCIPESGTVAVDVPIAATTPTLEPRFGRAIEQTLADAPKADGLQARFTVQGGQVKLSVTGAPVRGADVAHAYFYPYDGTVIDQAKPQLAERGTQGVALTLPAGYGFSHGKPPARLQGVVSFGAKSFEVDATPGAPLAGAVGLAPPVVTTPPPVGGHGEDAGKPADMGVLAAVGLAFVGGLILNLMPCVFPVLSMKAAAIARHLESPAHARKEGLAFLFGTVGTFVGLAALLIAARAGGQAVGWGFQLQSPIVVSVLALVMFGAGLNLSGVFEIGLSAQGVGAQAASKGGLAGAVLTGVLAVVVAAPCTAPFMAPAIGWALVQPPAVALLVFLALGLGLGAPFTALSFAPGLFRRLPPPGAWMEGLKKVLAFPMYGAAAWLVWVFSLQVGVAALPLLFAAALLLAFAAFCWGVSQRTGHPLAPRAFAATALIAAVAAIGFGPTAVPAAPASADTGGAVASSALPTQPWSPERVATLQAAGKPVFVDFTAAWCVTCQVNERTALATRSVADAFTRTGAVYLKADWTRRDPAIEHALAEQGRSGVPLYLVYGASGTKPQLLPQLLTPGVVVQALNAASGKA
ncbi:protein-disulfide reductase DsbD [Caulobacter sp. S45]|uniref:protein-disulfide reductase DsbD family protein n=1 Tax=Caulobacter sp. S45 TaxID=1641861 RepID=UPI00131BF062|nr:thioredoxin family protein [Caulobacter sp. S45]